MNRLALALPLLLAIQTGPSTTHVFSTPGDQPVTLTVCNPWGCSSKTKIVRVLDPRPSPPRAAVPARVGSAEQSLSLTATASGRPTLSWDWTVSRSDRSVHLSSNPATWVFDALGAHQVLLNVRNSWGSATSPLIPVEVVPSSFQDVPPSSWAFEAVETLAARGITAGCADSPRRYCPDRPLSRAEAAVQLAATVFGPLDRLPRPTGLFEDVPVTHWAAAAIEEIARKGVTAGCNLNPRRFCPDRALNRAEAAVLLIRAGHGASFTPPAANGRFFDVLPSSPAAPYIEQLARDGVTGGCSASPPRYCPDEALTRAQLATFLVFAFRLAPTPSVAHFSPRVCSSPCTHATGVPVVFDSDIQGGIPARYEYDWEGDGTFEEASTLPVLAHTFTKPGIFRPALRVRRGDHVALLASAAVRILTATTSGLPSRPSGVSATFREVLVPGSSDPPGTLTRSLYSIAATSGRAVGLNCYISVNSSAFRLIDALPAGGLPAARLAVPAFSRTDIVSLQLRPFNEAGAGPASLNIRLTLP